MPACTPEVPLAIASINIKYLGVALAKQSKDWYDKNFNTLWKKNKKISKDGNMCHPGLVALT